MTDLYCDPARLRQALGRPLVFGHRGLPGDAVENRLAAFSAAAAAGADGIEFDVQLAADGVPVVIHDSTLDRTAGRPGAVGATGSAELAAIGVPLFEAVLRHVPPPVLLNIELKAAVPYATGLEHAVLELLSRYGAQGRALISSFNPWSLARVRRADPRVYTAQLTAPRWRLVLPAGRGLRSPGIHPHVEEAGEEACARWRAKGRRVILWGDRDEAQLEAALRLDVDGAITDRPAEAARMLGGS